MKLRTSDREHGSMFILVLMVLLIVTFIGLSLVFVTETENQLGGVDKTITTTFYAAETGLQAAVLGVPLQNWEGEKAVFEEGRIGPDTLIGTRFVTSRSHVVGAPQLPPWTMANEGGVDYKSFSLVIESTAERVSWPDTEPVPIYEEGDPKEDLVTIQTSKDIMIRVFISPLSPPASPMSAYDEATPVEF